MHKTQPKPLTDAAWVQENLPEEVALKRTVFAELDRLAPPDAILASSTSAIVASQFTADLAGRARCLVAHPVNPPHLVPVVELCGAPWTSEATLDRARADDGIARAGAGLVRREIEGFVLNRLQGALLTEAMRLVADGVVSPDDLDKTMRDGLGMRWSFMGPFETIELNAPGGVADYCARYSGFYRRLAVDPAPPAVWEEQSADARGCGARRAVDRRTTRAAHRVARPPLAGVATAQTRQRIARIDRTGDGMAVSNKVTTQGHHHVRRYRRYSYAVDVPASADHTEGDR